MLVDCGAKSPFEKGAKKHRFNDKTVVLRDFAAKTHANSRCLCNESPP